MWISLLIVAGILFVSIACLAWQIDDWSRDFVQNRAATSADAANAALRPIKADVPPGQVARLIEEVVDDLRGWQIESQSESETRIQFMLTRTSRLFRFVDNVTVRIEPTADGCVINATSQSRVGKGDLGQNPRNIAELFSAIRKRLAGKQ